MTTLQEAQMKLIDAYADAVADYVASDYCMAGDNPNLGERAKEARAAVVAALAQQDDTDLLTIAYLDGRRKGKAEALAQQGEQQPSAYLTIADTGDMVWPPEAYDEACTYCDDDENPVPLYTAAPAPQAQPMTDPCKTCSHFKKGNLPGVRIHDETCYECRSYWGNKWEAA